MGAMQEQQHQIKIYGFLQKAVYAVVALDCASLFYLHADIPVVSGLLKNFSKMSFIYPPVHAKFATLVLIGLVAIGTKAKKQKDLNIVKDRKSTRLNSSHVRISYAVFCLKKKNK